VIARVAAIEINLEVLTDLPLDRLVEVLSVSGLAEGATTGAAVAEGATVALGTAATGEMVAWVSGTLAAGVIPGIAGSGVTVASCPCAAQARTIAQK
jgi:hypothetical protein